MDDKELRDTARRYRRITNQIKVYEQDQGILRRRILDEMARRDLRELRLGTVRIFVTDVTTNRIDTAKLWQEAPQLAKMYAVVNSMQRLTVS